MIEKVIKETRIRKSCWKEVGDWREITGEFGQVGIIIGSNI